MNNNSDTYKSSVYNKLFGFFFIIIGIMLLFGSFTIPIKYGNYEIILLIVGVILGVSLIYVGYRWCISQEFTINDVGIKLRKGKKIAFTRSWSEISKIRTWKWSEGEGINWFITILFIGGDKFELSDETWLHDKLKTNFRQLMKYQNKYHFQIEDEENWGK